MSSDPNARFPQGPPKSSIKAHIVVGLSFGDEGKGSVVDALTRYFQSNMTVRFNGGPQAAHHVVRADGHVHCFSQFGAGSFAPNTESQNTLVGIKSFLSRQMLIEPIGLELEAEALQRAGLPDPMKHLRIDGRCVLITPFHRTLNRLQELLRGKERHGSCGLGVGQAWLDHQRGALSIFAEDVKNHAELKRKLSALQEIKLNEARALVDSSLLMGESTERMKELIKDLMKELRRRDLVPLLCEAYREILLESGACVLQGDSIDGALGSVKVIVFEGAQGVLLDAERGFWPHVTPSNTTFENALALLDKWKVPAHSCLRWGVLRAYSTRHGAGPLPTENERLTIDIPDLHNGLNTWQGGFRVGWFDGLLARLALQITGSLERFAVTNLDRLAGISKIKICRAYRISKNSEIFGDVPLKLEDLCLFTESEDAFLISDLKYNSDPDREHQGRMTRLLRACYPVYEIFDGWPEDCTVLNGALHPNAQIFLCALARISGVGKVSLVSFGPSAEEKYFS